MKRKKRLNNKGFAVSVILYTAVALVVLILLLILSILSTNYSSKLTIVDTIKKEVSGIEKKEAQSLGVIDITASDNKGSGEWHTTNVTLSISKPSQNGVEVSFPIEYYYSTNPNSVNTKLSDNEITITENTAGTTYYVRVCRANSKEYCSKVGSYLLKIDKNDPTFTVSGESEEWAALRTLTLTPTSVSGISYYEYYVTDFTTPPTGTEEIKTFTGNTIIINDPGQYVYIRATNNAGKKGSWTLTNLYVQSNS